MPPLTNDELAVAKALSIPSGYATLKLGIKPHPLQSQVIDNLFSKRKNKVICLCGNEVGKTKVICVSAILYAIEILNAKVVSTSATYRQVIKQLVPYLKEHSLRYPNWEFLENQIKINNETRYIGYSTSEDAKWQGWHETIEHPLLIIVDEGAGVKDDIFQSIARCNPTYLLITGSPLGPEGFLYSACTEINTMKSFQHFKITKYDCVKSKGWWLHDKDIKDFVDMWKIDHPLVLSSVYAEFATNIEGGVIALADIERCIRMPPTPDYEPDRHVALDFAAGGDENVIVIRRGNIIEIIKSWRERDTMLMARQMIEELDKLKALYSIRPNEVSGDADGLGLPVIQRMAELGWKINEFHGNSTAKDLTCKNRITDCWINACKRIRNCSIIMPNHQQLKLQLTSRKSFMGQTGKLQLESKEDMRARGVPSPDIADAFCMAVSQPDAGVLTFAKVPLPTAKKYNFF